MALVTLGAAVWSTGSNASMVDQLIYNVAGQVTNAIGSRLGDEIYYGGSGRQVKQRHRVHHKKRHKKRHKSKRTSVNYKLTDQQKIQKALLGLGFYHGAIDGEVNSFETRSAIKALNNAYGIGNTASLTPDEKDSLIFLGTLFSFDRYLIANNKSSSTKNKKIQVALKIQSFYHGPIDGSLGSGSRKAIREYKVSNALSEGSSLDFEEEYQLISSAKQKNDAMLEDIINSLRNLGQNNLQTQHYAQQQTGSQAPYTPSRQQSIQQPMQQQPVQTQAYTPEPLQTTPVPAAQPATPPPVTTPLAQQTHIPASEPLPKVKSSIGAAE